MLKRARRVHRSRANASRPRHARALGRPSASPAKQEARDGRPLLARILDTPLLPQIVPRLRPEILHRVIERCGLEECGELVALATPAQLTGILDIDLWRSRRPGHDEHLDGDRFGVWLEVLVDSGDAVAARALASLDVEVVTAALAQHVLVFDIAAISRSEEIDEQIDDLEASAHRGGGTNLSSEIGGYLIEARRDDAWDAIVTALLALDTEHPDAFHRLMHGCRRLSYSTPEVDGLDDLLTAPEQDMFDASVERELRRHAQGYTTPAEARAFLQASRQLRVSQEGVPPQDVVAKGYFRAVDEAAPTEASGEAAETNDSASALASLVDVLSVEGVLQQPPRALLAGSRGGAERLGFIQSRLQFIHDADAGAYEKRSQELTFLANTLMAGCSIQSRTFTSQEASDAAVAVCNLGLENWPSHWRTASSRDCSSGLEATAVREDFLSDHDLVGVFQVGWQLLYQQVCMGTAERLIALLARLTCADPEIQAGLAALRIVLRKHWVAGEPWGARDALDVIMSLDMPAWATLVYLTEECPVIHAAMTASRASWTRAVGASAFEFISENSQIASVHAFMRSLPRTLGG